jgi:hypothetical protein
VQREARATRGETNARRESRGTSGMREAGVACPSRPAERSSVESVTDQENKHIGT